MSRENSVPRAEKRVRRALSHVGGEAELAGGSLKERETLSHALAVDAREEATLAHVHGFHSYPARLHPDTARRLILGFSVPGAVVLDPFAGSGTVLVEARLAGRRAIGIDASAFAIELAGLKACAPGMAWTGAIEEKAGLVAEHADARRRAKAGATHRFGADDVAQFDPHVLLELDGLRDGIERVKHPALRRALLLVLSASLTKVGRRVGDTTHHVAPKRIAGGYAIRFFLSKAQDLQARLAEAAEALPRRSPMPEVSVGDARQLELGDGSIDLVVSSPPYPGVYDYLEHHRARMRWLGLDARHLDEHEIGARRHARRATFAHAMGRFQSEFGAALRELSRVLRPEGVALIVAADSVLGGRAVRAERWLAELAKGAGLEVSAVASQERPHFHAPTQSAFQKQARREHAVVLRHAK